MEFKELENKVLAQWQKYSNEYKVDTDENYAVLKLGEEYGEFIQAYLIQKKLCRPVKIKPDEESKANTSAELTDIVGTVMLIANRLGIDLEQEIIKKWVTPYN